MPDSRDAFARLKAASDAAERTLAQLTAPTCDEGPSDALGSLAEPAS